MGQILTTSFTNVFSHCVFYKFSDFLNVNPPNCSKKKTNTVSTRKPWNSKTTLKKYLSVIDFVPTKTFLLEV